MLQVAAFSALLLLLSSPSVRVCTGEAESLIDSQAAALAQTDQRRPLDIMDSLPVLPVHGQTAPMTTLLLMLRQQQQQQQPTAPQRIVAPLSSAPAKRPPPLGLEGRRSASVVQKLAHHKQQIGGRSSSRHAANGVSEAGSELAAINKC